MNRIRGPNRLARKRTARSLDNLNVKPQDIPMGSCAIEACPAIGDPRLRNLTQCQSANQNAVALDQRQIGSEDQSCGRQCLTNDFTLRLTKQPG